MRNVFRYITLFAATLLLQTFFFDRLTLSVYFAPMIYIAVLLLLPVKTPAMANLAVGLIAGAVTDLLCGTAGLHTIASLAAGYVRRPLLTAIVGHEGMRDGSIPSARSIGRRQFAQYFILMTVLHALVFYLFEVFTIGHILHTLLRFALGTLSSLLFLWIAAYLFTSKDSGRQ